MIYSQIVYNIVQWVQIHDCTIFGTLVSHRSSLDTFYYRYFSGQNSRTIYIYIYIYIYMRRISDVHLWYPIFKSHVSRPRQQSSWGQHGAHLGPVGPIWTPCWPHEPYYQGMVKAAYGVIKCVHWHSLSSFLINNDVMKPIHYIFCKSRPSYSEQSNVNTDFCCVAQSFALLVYAEPAF